MTFHSSEILISPCPKNAFLPCVFALPWNQQISWFLEGSNFAQSLGTGFPSSFGCLNHTLMSWKRFSWPLHTNWGSGRLFDGGGQRFSGHRNIFDRSLFGWRWFFGSGRGCCRWSSRQKSRRIWIFRIRRRFSGISCRLRSGLRLRHLLLTQGFSIVGIWSFSWCGFSVFIGPCHDGDFFQISKEFHLIF